MTEPITRSDLFQSLPNNLWLRNGMKRQKRFNKKGITLVELVVGLVICGMVVAGIYRLFVSQTRAYAVQDQVVEVQQNIRIAMEILLRDLRMAGFDSDNINSKIDVANPIIAGENSVTVDYEYDYTTRYTVAYWRDGASSRLMRQLTVTKDDGSSVAGPQDILLDNVNALNFTYGIDANQDGAMDDRNGNGTIDDADWVSAAIAGTKRVVAVRVTLTARPAQVNPDLQAVSPRTLISAVTLRNFCLMR